jgi:hypothetical protein
MGNKHKNLHDKVWFANETGHHIWEIDVSGFIGFEHSFFVRKEIPLYRRLIGRFFFGIEYTRHEPLERGEKS